MRCLEEQVTVARELELTEELQYGLRQQAEIYRQRDDAKGALYCLDEQEAICKRWAFLEELQDGLQAQVEILIEMGDPVAAVQQLQERERVLMELGDTRALEQCRKLKEDLRTELSAR
jgi:hypothetical protein